MKPKLHIPEFNVLHLAARLREMMAFGVTVGWLATGITISGQTVPALMNYQGKRVDAAGNSMANGSYDGISMGQQFPELATPNSMLPSGVPACSCCPWSRRRRAFPTVRAFFLTRASSVPSLRAPTNTLSTAAG